MFAVPAVGALPILPAHPPNPPPELADPPLEFTGVSDPPPPPPALPTDVPVMLLLNPFPPLPPV